MDGVDKAGTCGEGDTNGDGDDLIFPPGTLLMFHVQKMMASVTSCTQNITDPIAIIPIPGAPPVPGKWSCADPLTLGTYMGFH